MARPTLSKHRKFRELSIILGSKALAWGSLELLWECGYDSGDPVLGSSLAVENAADWRGANGELTRALLSCGFIDADDNGIYSIHDLYHHMPDYVKTRMEREASRALKGKSISDIRKEAGKAGGLAKASKTVASDLANENHLPDPGLANVPTRALALALAPKRYVRKAIAYSHEYEELWKVHNYGAKSKGWEEYKRMDAPPEHSELLTILKSQVEAERVSKKTGSRLMSLPHLERWIKNRMWENGVVDSTGDSGGEWNAPRN